MRFRREGRTRGRSAFPSLDRTPGSDTRSYPTTRHTAFCRAVEPRGSRYGYIYTVPCPRAFSVRPGSTIAYHKERVLYITGN